MKKLFLNGLYNSFRNPSRNDLSFTQNFDIKHQTLTQNFDLECLPRLHDSVILIRNRDKLKHFIFFLIKLLELILQLIMKKRFLHVQFRKILKDFANRAIWEHK